MSHQIGSLHKIMLNDDLYMHRCLQLAQLAAGNVAPNPMVGAVLVHDGIIIGEGYHRQYGRAHAEVNCISNVPETNTHLIPSSTLYVSLEPCAHFGKTPPCADLIIAHNIKKVVIGCEDPFNEVNGKGIEKLKAAGIEVTIGVLRDECIELNKRFFTFHKKQRPFIVLKWAQTANSRIAAGATERFKISNELTDRLVHKWRSEEAAIMVGTNTALQDDPSLTTRLWEGNNPVRIVIDMNLRLPESLKIFTDAGKTIIINKIKDDISGSVLYLKIDGTDLVAETCKALYDLNIQSILIEGGSKLLQAFIDGRAWDEARIITNTGLTIEAGLMAPVLKNGQLLKEEAVLTDRISFYSKNHG